MKKLSSVFAAIVIVCSITSVSGTVDASSEQNTGYGLIEIKSPPKTEIGN